LAALICLMALPLLFACGDSGPESGSAGREPLDLELILSPGAEPGRAVAVVRLLSRALTQRELDQGLLPKEKRQKIEPIKIAAGAELWTKAMTFEVRSARGETVRLTPGQTGAVRTLRHPRAAELLLGPASAAQAVYLLDDPRQLGPGSKVRAVLKVENREIASPYRALPTPPSGPFQAALRRARTARWMGDAQAMMAAGREIAAAKPNSPAGPWYQGLAQERLGQTAAALGSYRKAMKLWLQQAKPAQRPEPPLGLARRISRLERAGSKP
jgi:hypothetical protein